MTSRHLGHARCQYVRLWPSPKERRDPQSSGPSDPESRDISCDTPPREITQEDSDVIEDSAITVSEEGEDCGLSLHAG